MMTSRGLIRLVLMLSVLCGSAWAQTIGTLVGIQGEAVVLRNGTESRLALSAAIQLNDRILTRTGSRVQILFNDDSMLALGENSDAIIDTYVYNPTVRADNSFGARLGKGVFRLITGKITDLNPDRFKVQTARSSIGIRGCELGFIVNDQFDRILLIRIPAGRQIIIGPYGETDRARVFPRAGRMITIYDGGRIQEEDIPPGMNGKLFNDTTPKETGDGGEEPGSLAGAVYRAGGNTGPDDSAGIGDEDSPDGELPPTDYDEFMQDDSLRDAGEEIGEDLPLVYDSASSDSDQDTGGSAGESGSQAAPKPLVRPLNGGRGMNIDLNSGALSFYQLQQGSITREQVNGQIVQYTELSMNVSRYDTSGNLLGTTVVDLGRIPLEASPNGSIYSGPLQFTRPGGEVITQDNLGEFIRMTQLDTTAGSQSMLYWGIQDPNALLPSDSLVTFDVEILNAPANRSVRDPQAPRTGTLIWNTRTGAVAIDTGAGGGIGYGSSSRLELYGSEAQGVGGMLLPPYATPGGTAPNQGTQPESSVLAGFRDPGAPLAAPDGTRSMQGYAAGVDLPPAGGPFVRYLSSADPDPFTTAPTGPRVQFDINRDLPANNVDASLIVGVNPSVQDVNDLQMTSPQGSLYVRDDRFQVNYSDNNYNTAVEATDAGENWVWGEWAGEHQVNFGNGDLPQYTEGFWAAGDVIPAAAFQSIVSGAQGYSLQTPADRPGIAAAKAGDAYNFTTLIGSAQINVSIPGNSSTPSWSGSFANMTDGNGNSLNMSVGGGFSAGGRMEGSASSYELVLPSGTRTAGAVRNDVTGSLVGPGSGTRPITAAIGEGALDFSDGTRVRLVFGTDLAAPSITAP